MLMAEIFWHSLPIEEVIRVLKTDPEKGLTKDEVETRVQEFGKNLLPQKPLPSSFALFLGQFKDVLIVILLIAGLLTFVYQKYADTLAIFLIVFLSALIGFYQERRAWDILEGLRRVARMKATVIRDGNKRILDSEEVVPGDIVILEAGDKVPADARIIKSREMKINEMELTGEFLPSEKRAGTIPEKTPLVDRENMLYMGTIVEQGEGLAVVTATGFNTELGRIAGMIEEKESPTPLQNKIKRLGFEVAGIIGIFVFIIFLIGLSQGRDFFLLLETAVATAVGAVPEGLPAAVTITLALGAERILRKKGLVKNLTSVETLGSTAIICSDKTLTLTEGKMRVEGIEAKNGDKFLALKSAVLTSKAFIENPEEPKEKWILRGSPTEKAVLKKAIEMGLDYRAFEPKLIQKIPFNSKDKIAFAFYKEDGLKTIYACGAPEKVLRICQLKEKERNILEKRVGELTGKGLRVLASAGKKGIRKTSIQGLKDLTFFGFLTLTDPLRPEAKEAIKVCCQAKMAPIIVTGDHKLTAKVVSEKLGIKVKDENILEGKDIDRLSDEQLDMVLEKIKIYARVEPRHKLRIVKAWQRRNKVVAMTGDGINDAPALRRADIGVALGSGTEAAKEAADLILANDSFSVIKEAVREGRRVVDNIRKAILFMGAECFSEIILVFGSFIFHLPLPVLPVQILWENLLVGSPQGMAFAFEPVEKGTMKRMPEDPKLPLVTREMKYLIFFGGILTDFILFLIFLFLYKFSDYPLPHIRTIIFAGLSWGSLFYLYSCKNLRKNIWEYNVFSNRTLNITLFLGVLMILAGIYLPVFQALIKTVPLNYFDWLILFLFGFFNLAIFESVKYAFKKKIV